jgi:hypothetical protein
MRKAQNFVQALKTKARTFTIKTIFALPELFQGPERKWTCLIDICANENPRCCLQFARSASFASGRDVVYLFNRIGVAQGSQIHAALKRVQLDFVDTVS